MKLLTLCSGIGAPEIAATWLGWDYALTCEVDPFCRRVLQYHYPSAYHHGDIKTLTGKIVENELSRRFGEQWRDGGTVLVAGFPCQPFSVAGKRLGASDDRHLWPEVLRLVGEIRPRWFIGENVAGILSMVLPGSEVKVGSYQDVAGESYEEVEVREQSVVERVCSDLESVGYPVVPLVIPACAVGAPHRRDRVWFLASDNRPSPHPDGQRRSELHASPVASQPGHRPPIPDTEIPSWEHFPTTQPAIHRGDDGISLGLSGITFPKWRAESIRALGNSMVPPLLHEFFRIIQEIENGIE